MTLALPLVLHYFVGKGDRCKRPGCGRPPRDPLHLKADRWP